MYQQDECAAGLHELWRALPYGPRQGALNIHVDIADIKIVYKHHPLLCVYHPSDHESKSLVHFK